MNDRERIERERAAHYAALAERKRERRRSQGEPDEVLSMIGVDASALESDTRPARSNARRPASSTQSEPDNGSRMWEARTRGDLLEDLSALYAELLTVTDPARREEIELEIFQIEIAFGVR